MQIHIHIQVTQVIVPLALCFTDCMVTAAMPEICTIHHHDPQPSLFCCTANP